MMIVYNYRFGAMFASNFAEYAHHLQGCRVEMAAQGSSFLTVGADDVQVFTNVMDGQSKSSQLKREGAEITAIAINPKNTACYAFGTRDGMVRVLRPIHQMNLQQAQLIYTCDKAISSLKFSPSGKYLLVSDQQDSAVLLSMLSKRMHRLPNSHQGIVINTGFATQNFIYSLGSEGNLHLYSFQTPVQNDEESQDLFGESESQLSIRFVDKYRIANEKISKTYAFMKPEYASQLNGSLLCPGMTVLQRVSIQKIKRESTYQLISQIYQSKQILTITSLCGQENVSRNIVVSTVDQLSIWNMNNRSKSLNISVMDVIQGTITRIQSVICKEGRSFVFMANNLNSSGKCYYFKNTGLLSVSAAAQSSVQQQKIPQISQLENRPGLAQRRMNKNKLHHLFPNYPQFPLEKGYADYDNARFVFYNSVGCIVQRNDSENPVLQLQLHDKSRCRRLKIDSNRMFSMFALTDKILLFASRTLLSFQEEKQAKDGLDGWEFRWDDIQAIAIGGEWVAAASQEQIKILDFAGNELHSISFDRRMVAMEAYEDMLAVVYHSAPPTWGCQSLKMAIFSISGSKVMAQRDVIVPIKGKSQIKWFGFSQEGMIFCHDTFQVIRCYLFDEDQWQSVFSLQEKPQKFFIQHIEGTQLYGFKIQQSESGGQQPKVLPRSLPRKYNLQMRNFNIKQLSKDEQKYLTRLMFDNIQLKHEEFRYKRWYKHKYSRGRDHSWYRYCQNIKSDQQLKTTKVQIDWKLHQYVRKYAERLREKPSEQIRQICQGIMMVCQRESHFEETKEKIKSVFKEVDQFAFNSEYEQKVFRKHTVSAKCVEKLNQLSILQKMSSLVNAIQ